ncbi:immunity 49 family protein [Lentzea sp. NPDC006480]|uniref:immunity 49 family protein n=1 Tax=Lentzea sp. NPDC006480 TaxID=3157176 RepID=UPI0033A0385F
MTRHRLQVPSTEGVDARIANTVEQSVAELETDPRVFNRLLSALQRLMGWRCYLDPAANEVESWEATVMAMQAANAIFEIARADQGEVSVLVGEKTVTVPAGSTRDIAHAGNWVTACYLAVICREQDRLKMLAETPIDLLRASGADFDEYIYAWVDTLQTYWRGGPGIGAKLQAAVEGTDPEVAEVSANLMLRVLYPPINLFHRFLENRHEEFNDALAQALELNKEYWDTPEEGRDYMPNGALPLGALAMTCLAHDAEFPIKVESDYLPEHLVQRTWLGEFPTR